MALLYLPTQKHSPIGGERVTCHGSKLTNSLGRQQLELRETAFIFQEKGFTIAKADQINKGKI